MHVLESEAATEIFQGNVSRKGTEANGRPFSDFAAACCKIYFPNQLSVFPMST
jgi:hypothetical protein